MTVAFVGEFAVIGFDPSHCRDEVRARRTVSMMFAQVENQARVRKLDVERSSIIAAVLPVQFEALSSIWNSLAFAGS